MKLKSLLLVEKAFFILNHSIFLNLPKGTNQLIKKCIASISNPLISNNW